MADVSSGRWQDEADPELRPLVVKQLYVVVYLLFLSLRIPQIHVDRARDQRTAPQLFDLVFGGSSPRLFSIRCFVGFRGVLWSAIDDCRGCSIWCLGV